MAKQKQTPKVNQPKPAPPVINKQEPPVNKLDSKTPSANLLLLILVAVALLVNAPTLRYDYTLDDPFFTSANPLVMRGTESIPEFFKHAAYYGVFENHDASYRPLLLISFALEKEFFGFNPVVSHGINLLLFAAQVMVLFLLMKRIFHRVSVYIPFFIVLLFALHPIHTEVVASVKSRDEIMAVLFAGITMLHSMKYIDTNKIKYLVFSAIFFFIALISKETPVTFVAIIPMTIYFFRDVKLKQVIIACVPLLVIVSVYMMMRAAFIESDGKEVRILVNNNALMAATNYGEKLATLLFIQLKYIILLIFPHPLSYDYSFNQIPIIGFSNVKAIASFLVLAGMLVYALLRLKSKDVFAYCILFYLGSMVTTSNLLVDIGATMAERFVYAASLGFCIAFVFLFAKLFKSDTVGLNYPTSSKLFYLIIPVAVLYSVKTIARNEAWKNNFDLYLTGVETAPNSWRAQYLLGAEYTRRMNGETAPVLRKELFDNALTHLNSSLGVMQNVDVWIYKAFAFEFAHGYDDSAIHCYKMTLALDSNDHQAANNLGSVYLRRNQLDAAIAILSKVVAKDTIHTDALANLAAAYGNKGMFKEAEKYYMMVLRKDPDPPQNVLMSVSNIYKFMGDSVNAPRYRQLLFNKMSRRQ